MALLSGSVIKNLPAMQETWVQLLGRKIPWRKAEQLTPVFLPGKSNDTGSNQNSYGEILFLKYFYLFIYLFIFWPHHMACGICVPKPGVKPAVDAHGGNHWTTRKVPVFYCFNHRF